MLRHSLLVPVALALLLLGAAVPASAQDDPWRLRVSAVTASGSAVFGTGDLGVGLGVEYLPHPRFGFELSTLDVPVEDEIDIFGLVPEGTHSTDFRPILLAARYHVASNGPVDFYFGPVVGYASLGSTSLTVEWDGEVIGRERVDAKDQFVYGFELGLDVRLGDRFLLSAGASRLEVPLEAENPSVEPPFWEGDLDPFVFRLGVGFRF